MLFPIPDILYIIAINIFAQINNNFFEFSLIDKIILKNNQPLRFGWDISNQLSKSSTATPLKNQDKFWVLISLSQLFKK